jgi:dTDP-4-amino-4,6-dideoxygalactose transaminase
MIPRKRLDIGWSDLAFGLTACIRRPDREAIERRLERAWGGDRPSLPVLSVRTGFDLVLRRLAWSAGDEVLVSAVTIRDMVRIIEHHGLRAVPIDIDPATAQPTIEAIHQAVTARTRGILVAHLFGARIAMEPIADAARRHGLFVVEDCAQAFAADGYCGHPDSDVAMFSFGPIKTATALGGAVLTFRNLEHCDAARAAEREYPLQSGRSYAGRILKYAALKGLTERAAYSIFVGLCRLCGTSHDRFISGAVRGFAGDDLIGRIRRRPSAPLLAMLDRRLRSDLRRRIDRRIAAAEFVAERLADTPIAGCDAQPHSHWVFPVVSRNPTALVERLAALGFDAAHGTSSLFAVPAVGGDMPATDARRLMEQIVYLPVDSTTTASKLEALADAVSRFEATCTETVAVAAGTPVPSA